MGLASQLQTMRLSITQPHKKFLNWKLFFRYLGERQLSMYDIIKFDETANVAKPAFVAVPTKRLNISITTFFL